MKKYFNYFGSMEDKGQYHVVQNGKVITYENRGFLSMFKSPALKRELPVTRETKIEHILVHKIGSGGKGCCKLTTGAEEDYFSIYNGIEDFINDVRREMDLPPATIKNVGGCFEIT